MVPLLIFDLDGTLVDSKKDLAVSVNYVRQQFGLPPLSDVAVAQYIGNGAQMLVRGALGPGRSDQDVADGLKLFLSYYREHMLDHTVLYPGVVETLDRLSHCRLAVLTNKPVKFSCAMLQGLGVFDR